MAHLASAQPFHPWKTFNANRRLPLSHTFTDSGGKDCSTFWEDTVQPVVDLSSCSRKTSTPVCRWALPCPVDPRVGNWNPYPGPRRRDKKRRCCISFPAHSVFLVLITAFHAFRQSERPQILVRPSCPALLCSVAPCFGIQFLPVLSTAEVQRGLCFSLGESWVEEGQGAWGCFRALMASLEESDA